MDACELVVVVVRREAMRFVCEKLVLVLWVASKRVNR